VWEKVHTQKAMSINDGMPGFADTARYGEAAWCKATEDVCKHIFR
jgi:hypothetical protein